MSHYPQPLSRWLLSLSLLYGATLLSACGNGQSTTPDSGTSGTLQSGNIAAVSAETLAVSANTINALEAAPDLGDLGLGALALSGSSGASVGTQASTTLYCGDGSQGSFTLDVGVDTLMLQFMQCQLGPVVLDGDYTIAAITGDLASCPGKFSFQVTVNDFQVDDGVLRTRLLGGYDYALAQIDSDIGLPGCETQIQTFGGPSLVMEVDGVRSELSDFLFTDTLTGSASYEREYQATLSSTAAGGSVTARTLSPIVGDGGSPYPSAGIIEIRDGTAVVTVTILHSHPSNAEAVVIEFDSDADGLVDERQSYSWAALDALYRQP